uniref:Uncharacterized protein n=1 Tax=Anas zonorhyncha TaxID=75864 RepID=A0A8B9VAF3_9AVES
MAQGNAVKNLREEATCAVCLDFFRRPVMLLPCGHNFCRSCVTRCAQKSQDGAGSCPLCRLPFPPGGFCPNRQLANVVAAVRELVEGEDLGLGGDLERRVPPAEPLEDRVSQAPRPKMLGCEQIALFLPKSPQKNAWMGENCPLPPQITPKKMLGGERISQIPLLWGHKNLYFGAIKFSILGHQKTKQTTKKNISILEHKTPLFWGTKSSTLGHKTLYFWAQNPLFFASPRLYSTFLGGIWASVTLDPATAHPQILVSPDGRSARRCKTPRDPPPGSSERFEALRCVLGRQGFAAGRHRWAVEVSPGPDWALGVAREFVPRKGCFGLSPARGVWAVGQWLGQLRALTWPSPTCLHLARVPKRIEVALDYGGGRAETPAVVGRRAGPAHFLPLKIPQKPRVSPQTPPGRRVPPLAQ